MSGEKTWCAKNFPLKLRHAKLKSGGFFFSQFTRGPRLHVPGLGKWLLLAACGDDGGWLVGWLVYSTFFLGENVEDQGFNHQKKGPKGQKGDFWHR